MQKCLHHAFVEFVPAGTGGPYAGAEVLSSPFCGESVQAYERVDKPRGEFFPTNWTGLGGRVFSSTHTG